MTAVILIVVALVIVGLLVAMRRRKT